MRRIIHQTNLNRLQTGVLQRKMKYGVVDKACYWYRKRMQGSSSAIQSSLNNKKWYLDYMKHFALWTAENSKAGNWGKVPLFVQYTLMYDLQWRFNSEQAPELVLNKDECTEYFSVFKKVDEELFEELEEILVMADIGVNTATEICDILRAKIVELKKQSDCNMFFKKMKLTNTILFQKYSFSELMEFFYHRKDQEYVKNMIRELCKIPEFGKAPAEK